MLDTLIHDKAVEWVQHAVRSMLRRGERGPRGGRLVAMGRARLPGLWPTPRYLHGGGRVRCGVRVVDLGYGVLGLCGLVRGPMSEIWARLCMSRGGVQDNGNA